MLRTPYRARYFRCVSLVGALWHPSFIRARLAGAAAAFFGARLEPNVIPAAPEAEINRLRFIRPKILANPDRPKSHFRLPPASSGIAQNLRYQWRGGFMASRAPAVPKKAAAPKKDIEKQSIPLEEQIRQRAHQIYLQRGGQNGSDLDDWFQAEAQLRLAEEEESLSRAEGEGLVSAHPV